MSTVCFMEGWNQYTLQLELILLFIFTNGHLNKNLKTNKPPKKVGFPFLVILLLFWLNFKARYLGPYLYCAGSNGWVPDVEPESLVSHEGFHTSDTFPYTECHDGVCSILSLNDTIY